MFQIATMLLLAVLTALPCAAAPDAETYFTKTENLFRSHTAGVLRPDEGTVEIITTIDRPLAEFGNDWEFLFAVAPSRKIGSGANTLIGAFIPPEPEKGLAVLLRNGRDYYRVNVTNFTYTPGVPFVLALSWGKALQVYMNGQLIGSTPMRAGIDERYLSYQFRVERFAPYRTEALRISTRARAPRELLADAARGFSADSDTAFLATKGLSEARRFVTPWHRQNSYAILMPAWRQETQIFSEGERIFFPFVGINYGSTPRSYNARFIIKDLEGKTVAIKSAAITLPPDGRHHVEEVVLPLSRQNYYRVETTVASGNATEAYESALSIVPRMDPAKAGALASYYGQHQHSDYDTAAYRKIDTRSSRAWAGGKVFLWHSIEPVRGKFQWAHADAYVRQCRAAGMDIIGVLGYPSRWAAADPGEAHKKLHELAPRPERWKPSDLQAWGRYVYETVKRYGKDVTYWEIYNEVNFSPPGLPATFSGSPEEYLQLLKIAYTEAKRANPACSVLISGFSADVNKGMPSKLIEMGALDYCDIFNVHGYSGVEGAAQWVAAMKKHKPTMPYWQTEQMWHQLQDVPKRLYLTVAYYADFLAAGYARYYHMGTNEVFSDRYTQSPTPDYQTLAVIQDEVRACDRFVERYAFPGSDVFGLRHRFARKDGKTLSILGSEMGAYDITFKAGEASARDILGQPLPITAKDGAMTVHAKSAIFVVSDVPLTITGVTAKSRVSLYANGGFEDTEGDITMGGLKAGRPRGWQWRDKNYDPGGAVVLSDDAHAGKYALAVTSTGQGRVYAFQYTKTFAPGKYVLSAHFKRAAGDETLRPYFFVYDIEGNTIENRMLEGVTGAYGRFTWEVQLPQTGKLAIGMGINGGAGTVLIDDVSFDPADAH